MKDQMTRQNQNLVLGIDEVGRGSWAGPLVVGAVVLPTKIPEGLTDSKLLSRKQRDFIATDIKSCALFCKTGWVWPEEIDRTGLTEAISLAITRAIEGCHNYEKIIIDGSYNFLPKNIKSICMVKADLSVPAVSAASIVAKVERDEYMRTQAVIYPNYGFENHVGYGTEKHRKSLAQHGITPIHRTSFKPVSLYI